MKNILSYIIPLFILVLWAAGADAEDEKAFGGEVKVAAKVVDVNGSEYKYNEYRDIKDGVYAGLRLKLDDDRYFVKFKARDIAYDTQDYKLEGGMWGKFKLYLKYNEIPHNITHNAMTIFSGAGSNRLTTGAVLSPTNADPTNLFDYTLERRQFKAGVEVDALDPFYASVSFAREDREGIKPAGVPLRTGGGSYFAEIPEPLDYVTDSLKVEAGYATSPVFLSVAYFFSKFSNDDDKLFFVNPNSTNTLGATQDDYLTLPPDNKYHNYSFKGAVKLPLHSSLNANVARSETKSEFYFPMLNATQSYWIRDVAGGIQPVTLTDSKFDGKITANNYAFVLTSQPVDFLGAKAFYKYYAKKNKSDKIGHTDSNVNGGSQFFNHLFDYNNRRYGVEFDVALPAKFSLMPAYSHETVKRHRGDLPKTDDNVYSVGLKWSGVDFMTAKVAYERLNRKSTHRVLTALFATDQTVADTVEPYIRRFDAAPLERDTYKASVDIYPVDALDVGLYYNKEKSDYKDTVLGLKENKTDAYGIDADLKVGSYLAVSGYAEYEKTKSSQTQQYSDNTAGLDPNVADTTNNHTWKETLINKSYDYGAAAEVYAIPNTLTFKVQYDYGRSNGHADFTFFDFTPADSEGITSLDDYRKTAVGVKAKYVVIKNLAVTAGYAYERYKYSDIAVDNYLYSYGTASGSVSALTGAYSAPGYSANVVYLAVTYTM